MPKIISIEPRYLSDPAIRDVLPTTERKDLSMMEHAARLLWDSQSMLGSLTPRDGINNFPFKNTLVDHLGMRMPKYQANFNLSWNDITDLRALQIQQDILCSDKNLLIHWSGGIDSTCIIAAVLKNFEKSNLSRVRVLCNWMSILEYPKFYLDHICKNFQVIDSNFFDNQGCYPPDTLIINGQGADSLQCGPAPNVDYIMSVRDCSLLDNSWEKNPDCLIRYLGRITHSNKFASWYYEKISENIKSVVVPIETYYDFIWWSSFNYNWCHAAGLLFWHFRNNCLTWEQFHNQFISWYNTEDYQLWAMKNNGKMIKHKARFGSEKHHAKKYIFDYTRDKVYYENKIKSSSWAISTQLESSANLPFALTDDFKLLYLDTDLETILDLMPDYIK